MTKEEFRELMNSVCPEDLAEDWDNSGFQIAVSDGRKYGRCIYVALDITDRVIRNASAIGADTVVTHHPLFFDPLKTVSYDEPSGRYAVDLIRKGISVYSCHTNFDRMAGGMNDEIGRLLGVKEINIAGEDGYARCGDLPEPMAFDVFCGHVAKCLGLDAHTFRLAGRAPQKVKRVCWCGGAGAEFASGMKNTGSDIFVTGDLKYHTAKEAAERGLTILDIGHFGSEKCFVGRMTELLMENMPEGTEVYQHLIDEDCWKQL